MALGWPGVGAPPRELMPVAGTAGRGDRDAAGPLARALAEAGPWAGRAVLGDAALEAAVTGAVVAPAPYMNVPVPWTTPGLSVMPRTVTTWPAVSVSRTVNGPGPRPTGRPSSYS